MSKSQKGELKKFDKKNFKENFLRGELFHGTLVDQKEVNKINTFEKTVLFKFFYWQNKLYFCLFDYMNIYFNILEDKEILELNKDLNSSVEFNNIESLINFLKENLIFQNKNLIITYIDKKVERDNENNEVNTNSNNIIYEFTINSMLNNLMIKWVFNCEKVPENIIEYLSQSLFINPVHNCLLGLGNLINDPNKIIQNSSTGFSTGISTNDALMMIKCNYLGKKIGFNSSIINLLSCSSNVVNGYKIKNEESTTDDDEKVNCKAINQGKKKKKFYQMKKRKENKITYIEEKDEIENNIDEHVTQTASTEILFGDKILENTQLEKDSIKEGGASKEKDKKKKKKKFI